MGIKQDKRFYMDPKESAEWGRHFDILLWKVTTIMAAAISGLLFYTINKFDIILAIVGFFLAIIAVYFAASFREVRHKVGEYYTDGMKQILRSRTLDQWLAYRLIFVILAMLWIKLLIENCNKVWLICLWFTIGIIGTVIIMLYLGDEKISGKDKEKRILFSSKTISWGKTGIVAEVKEVKIMKRLIIITVMLCVIFLLLFGRTLMKDQTFWSAVGALASVAATAGIFFVLHQFKFEAWNKCQEVFTDSDFTDARGRIFSHIKDPDVQWTDEDRKAARRVAGKMDELCRLARFFGRRQMIKVWGDPIATSWILLQWFVQQERTQTGWDDKWEAFVTIGTAAVKKLPTEKRTKLNEISERIRDKYCSATSQK